MPTPPEHTARLNVGHMKSLKALHTRAEEEENWTLLCRFDRRDQSKQEVHACDWKRTATLKRHSAGKRL